MAHTPIRTRSAGLAAAAVVLGGFVAAASAPGPATAATPELVDTFSVGYFPFALAVSPDGGTLYVANAGDSTVMAVDTATGTAAPIAVGEFPASVALTPDGSLRYVANMWSDDVSVVDTAANTVTATVPVGSAAMVRWPTSPTSTRAPSRSSTPRAPPRRRRSPWATSPFRWRSQPMAPCSMS